MIPNDYRIHLLWDLHGTPIYWHGNSIELVQKKTLYHHDTFKRKHYKIPTKHNIPVRTSKNIVNKQKHHGFPMIQFQKIK